VRPVGSKYLLEEPLGRGATGTVWRARVRAADPEAQGAVEAGPAPGVAAAPGAVGAAGEKVAIKVLREELASDADVVMRFLRERSVLLRLTHPNIVRVRDLVVEGELLALVMDLIDGPDLHRHLREHGRLGPAASALLMAEVADALAASHADGIVHRDLKPANVLLATTEGPEGPRTHPMLTDFGIARLADSPGVTRTHEFVGTPAYVAPETAQGLAQTSAVDVYGAGIMLYELVTGRQPFEGDNPLAILRAHLSDEPRRPTSVPEPLWAVIEGCLRKRPEQRPSAVALASALRTVAAGIGVHATPEEIYAAERVGALLVPDAAPAAVPGTGAAAAAGPNDPTVPQGTRYDGNGYDGARYDPAAPTSVAGVVAAGGFPGAEDRTQVLPPAGDVARPAPAGAADRTQVLPPTAGGPGGPAGPAPGGPAGPGGEPHHPWETQLRAARTRNEQTQVFAPAEEQGAQVAPAPYRPQPQPRGQQRPQVAPPPYRPPATQQSQRPQQQPQRPAPDPAREQRAYDARRDQELQRERARERELERELDRERARGSRRPLFRPRLGIPGGGCLRTLVLLVVICALVWYFTPLHGWVDDVTQRWHEVSNWFDRVRGSFGG